MDLFYVVSDLRTGLAPSSHVVDQEKMTLQGKHIKTYSLKESWQ